MGEAAGGTEWGKWKERQQNRKGHEEEDLRIRGPRRSDMENLWLKHTERQGRT